MQAPTAEAIRKRELRALSRAITLAENKDPAILPILAELYPQRGNAQVIGITGPPGAGKSTLTSQFVKTLRKDGKSVAVLAVDPMSPFTGGALLGDRIRLTEHFNDSDVFIRSLSTRGRLGGLSLSSREVVHLLDAFGFDVIILETVGVGQSEVDVRKLADVTALVLVPEAGDAIQTIKAGVFEIADIFLINKADRKGADKIAADIRGTLEIAGRKDIPVALTRSDEEVTGIEALEIILKTFETKSVEIQQRRERASAFAVAELIEERLLREAHPWIEKNSKINDNPYTYAERFFTTKNLGELLNK